jgi:hypothetical protein
MTQAEAEVCDTMSDACLVEQTDSANTVDWASAGVTQCHCMDCLLRRSDSSLAQAVRARVLAATHRNPSTSSANRSSWRLGQTL